MYKANKLSINLKDCAKSISVGRSFYTTTVQSGDFFQADEPDFDEEYQITSPRKFEAFPLVTKILSKFSHDIKGHQRRILLYTEMLSQDDSAVDKEQYEKYVSVVMKNAEDSTKLMNRYTDFVRILDKSGTVEQLNMAGILDEILENLEADIEKHKVDIVIKSMPPFVVGSVQEVRILLYQLIENAVVHSSEEPSKITIEGKVLNNGFEFIIEDTGPGLTKETFESGFEHGVNLNGKRDSLGIGFTMVQIALKHLKANLWISSEEERGTRVRIFLPLLSIGNKGDQDEQ